MNDNPLELSKFVCLIDRLSHQCANTFCSVAYSITLRLLGVLFRERHWIRWLTPLPAIVQLSSGSFLFLFFRPRPSHISWIEISPNHWGFASYDFDLFLGLRCNVHRPFLITTSLLDCHSVRCLIKSNSLFYFNFCLLFYVYLYFLQHVLYFLVLYAE